MAYLENNFMALTLEMIFYNENYETGVQIIYQFLQNNSGHISKYTDATIYNKSMYKSNYRKYKSGYQVLFKSIDFIYLTGILIMLLAFIRKMYMRFREFCYTKTFNIPWYELIDGAVISLSVTNICYWFIIFINNNEVTLPITSNDEFTNICDFCYKFTQIRSIGSFQIVLICFRSIRILTTQFPAFGCLFDTIKYSAADLISFIVSMLIMCFGFIYSSCLLFGPNDFSFKDVWKAAQIVFFSMMNQNDQTTFQQSNKSKIISTAFYIVFMFVFTFVLMKMLITIVILKYRTIRSCKNLEVQARAVLIGEESKKYRKKWYNFLLCK